jgi:hypothetical protein
MTSLLAAFLATALAMWQASPASSKPDFSGSWTLDRGQSESATEPSEPVTLNIKHNSEAIVIETVRSGKPAVRTFPIDLTARRDGSASPSVSPRAYWDGVKLVTEGAINVQGQTVSTRETLSLNTAGTEMTVERLVVVQHGYSFRGAQNYGTAKDVYKRSRPESN